MGGEVNVAMKDHKLANEKVKALLAGEQLSLVVSYSDASASSPGFTVTESISIGRKGWYLETSTGTSDQE